MLTELGKEIRKARIDAGISMAQMCKGLSVAMSYMSMVEHGKKNITMQVVKKIEKYFKSLGVPVHLKDKVSESIGIIRLADLRKSKRALLTTIAYSDLSNEVIKRLNDVLETSQTKNEL